MIVNAENVIILDKTILRSYQESKYVAYVMC